jgi:hypothetical protein
MTATTPAIEEAAPADNLAALRSNYDAIQQHLTDVNERYNAARADLDDKIQQLETAWRNSYAELINEWQEIGEDADRAELALRTAIVKAYNETKQTQLGHGLSVQVRTRLVYDEAKAEAWARKSDVCLIFDKKGFEKLAAKEATRTPLKIDFVTETELPIAVIKN